MVDQIPQANTAPQVGMPPQIPPQTPSPQPMQVPGTSVQQAVQPQPTQPNGRPQTSTNITKPVSKISMKGIFIGCGLFFMFVVGGLALVFYNLINNPTQLTSVGLDPITTKTLLQTFSVIFFGVLTFLGIGLLVVNLYRIITVKNKSKLGYSIGALFGFIVFIMAIALGARVITLVKNFSVDSILDSNSLVMPYLQMKDGVKNINTTPNLYLIAPATMYYMMNTVNLTKVLSSLGQVQVQKISLDCGNGQKLTLNMTTNQFNGACTYFKKGEYPLSVTIDYINIPTSEKLQKSFSGGSIVLSSEIVIIPTKNDLVFNDANTEMIVGKAPVKVKFNASEIFRDFGLSDYKIIWDFNGDGEADKQNIVETTFVYNEAKLYNVYVRFPGLNNYIYTFPIRVEQSDVPICEVNVKHIEGKEYDITVHFFDNNVKISNYQFDVIDKENKDKIIDTIRSVNGNIRYQFMTAGTYAIQTTFLTEDEKQGQCESDDIQIDIGDFQIKYDAYFKTPQSPQFTKVTDKGIVMWTGNTLILTEIPTIIKIQINQIIPNTPTITKKFLLNGKPVISSDANNFEFTINDNANYEAKLIVEDKSSGTKSEISIPIIINRADLIGKLIVKPGTVGTDPFTVTFDASTSILNDTGDEIVSFTWDFGDGTPIKKNFPESIITHTYRYDTTKDNGEFRPVVIIKTKKGREISVSPETNIIVKRAIQKLDITIDSHPAQIAKVGDRVTFSIDFNGLPAEISRDFGDGKTLSCKTRQECSTTSNIYLNPGIYTVRATVSFVDQPTIDGMITVKINP